MAGVAGSGQSTIIWGRSKRDASHINGGASPQGRNLTSTGNSPWTALTGGFLET
jgi:hypothetical protein